MSDLGMDEPSPSVQRQANESGLWPPSYADAARPYRNGPIQIQDEAYRHHPCGCIEFSMFGATEPGSWDPSCPVHGYCTCNDPEDDRECPMHGPCMCRDTIHGMIDSTECGVHS